MSDIVSVLLPVPLARVFDYRVPAGLSVAMGSFVRVPFRRRVLTGVVWGFGDSGFSGGSYKSVIEVYDVPPMCESLRLYLDYLGRYYLVSAGLALKLVLSGSGGAVRERELLYYSLRETGDSHGSRDVDSGSVLTEKQGRVVSLLSEAGSLSMRELCVEAGVGDSVVRGLVKRGIVFGEARLAASATDASFHENVVTSEHEALEAAPRLTESQSKVLSELLPFMGSGFGVYCLRGVTGSGKSEVYFHLIESVLAAGKSVLLLLPEIALTQQWRKQFLRRFVASPCLWHSALSASQRRRLWRFIARGEVRFLVGARSALALPLRDVGLIIVDEEHDPGYKQEDNVNYHARDMAIVRGKFSDCPVVLVSATPSLETYHNIRSGRYREFRLSDRFGSGGFADVHIVNLLRERLSSARWISEPLGRALAEAYDAGEQSLLYLNRRGYAPLTLCRSCGYRLQCPDCSAWLVEHRRYGYWLCHHCDHRVELGGICPSCDAEGDLVACGPGVERLMEEVSIFLPRARLVEMTSDSIGGDSIGGDSMGSSGSIENFMDRMHAGEIDVVVGTQLIAKGYHFPQLTVVGIVDADMGLAGGDLRANERSFQLLRQVSGRAGRGGIKGRVFLQTTQADSEVLRAIAGGDDDAFYEAEWLSRERFGMPPCGRLAAVIVSSYDNDAALSGAKAYMRMARDICPAGVEILGPVSAPLAVLRRRYRYRLLVRCGSVRPQAFLARMRDLTARSKEISRGVNFRIDIDPINFY